LKICKKCNAELSDDLMTCPNCGANMQKNGYQGIKVAAIIAICLVLGAVLVVTVLWGSGMLNAQTPSEPAKEPGTSGTTEATVPIDAPSYTVDEVQAAAAATTVVATAGSEVLTNDVLQIFYWNQVYDFLNNYGTYYFDYTKPLDQQLYSQDGQTWQQFFLDTAVETWHRYAALVQHARENGFVLSQEQQTYLDGLEEDLSALMESYACETLDEMVRLDFGAGATFEGYETFMRTYCEALEYVNTLYDDVAPTAEEVEAYFDAHADEYAALGVTKDAQLIDVRHILIIPESDGTSAVYTDEQYAACKEEAQKILDQWLAGEATEDSFAAMAEEFTEDPGSAKNGGLYTGVYEGQMVKNFNDWIFDETRVPGDYGLVQSEYGYHIMYFVQSKDSNQWYTSAETDLVSDEVSEIIDSAMRTWPIEADYEKIVLGEVSMG